MAENQFLRELCSICLSSHDTKNIKESSTLKKDSNRNDLLQKVFRSLSLQLLEGVEGDAFGANRICVHCDSKLEVLTSFLEDCIHAQTVLAPQIKLECPEQEWDYSGLDSKLPIVIAFPPSDDADEDLEWDIPLSKLSQTGVNVLRCEVCSKPYKSAARLASHCATQHNCDPFKCSICHAEFLHITKLKRHESEHKTILKEICRICRRRFENKLGLLQHKKECHQLEFEESANEEIEEPERLLQVEAEVTVEESEEPVKGYRCNFCRALFPALKACKNHITENHLNEKPQFVKEKDVLFFCFCGKGFRKKVRLRDHKVKAHSIGISNSHQLRKCPECCKLLPDQKQLEYHRNRHLGLKPYLCSYCPAAYPSPLTLRAHEKFQHLGIAKPKPTKPSSRFLCNYCGNDFARKTGLERHMLAHMGIERKFHCSFAGCSLSFRSKERLNGHAKVHLSNIQYFCDECQKGFKSKYAVQLHKNHVHLNLRPFVCDTCQRGFKVKSHLVNHMRTHTGERPFPCPKCPYMCAEKNYLRKHLKIHVGKA